MKNKNIITYQMDSRSRPIIIKQKKDTVSFANKLRKLVIECNQSSPKK